MEPSVRDGYAQNARFLIQSFEALSSDDVLAHVLDFIPNSNARVLEIGAGTGRDAAWLASKGLNVSAVEPVDEFRDAGKLLHPSPLISWFNDSLPLLSRIIQRQEKYDLALLISVWQHIPQADKLVSLKNLSLIINKNGSLIISVRNGPGSTNRKCFPTSANETIALAQLSGFKIIHRCHGLSAQKNNRKANVTWTWLVFERD